MYNNDIYSASASSAVWNLMTGQQTNVDSADGSFAEIFGSRLKGTSGSGSATNTNIADMLSQLAARFPNANVKAANTGEGVKGSEETFGKEEGDNVAVDQNVLASMFGNSGLSQQIEDALASFFNSDAGSNVAAGAYSQRNVTITVTTVRFQVAQRDGETGDLLSSQELQSSLQDKLKDLINQIFGGASSASETDDDETGDASDEAEAADAAAGADSKKQDYSGLWNSAFSSTSWSMQLYYSNSFIQSMGSGQDGSSQSNILSQAYQFSASYQSYSANFSDFTNSYLPQSIYNQNSGFSFSSLIEQNFGQTGLTSGGFSQTTDGFLMSLRNGRDFLSELLELAGGGKTASVTGATEEEEVGVASEASAEAVAGI